MGAGSGVQWPHPVVQVGSGQSPATPRPRGGPRPTSYNQTNSTRETFHSQSAADSAPCPSQRARLRSPRRRPRRQRRPPTPSAALRPPTARPGVSARHPVARASRPSPSPARPRMRTVAELGCGGRPRGSRSGPGVVGRLGALELGEHEPDQGD